MQEHKPDFSANELYDIKSSSHSLTEASLGMRQSPRGDRETDPTLGPSGRQLLLNCCEKKRLKNFPAASRTSSKTGPVS